VIGAIQSCGCSWQRRSRRQPVPIRFTDAGAKCKRKVRTGKFVFARDRGQTGGRDGHRNRGLDVDREPINAIDTMALADSIAIMAMMATVSSMLIIARRRPVRSSMTQC
jgi:hypothetical protein